MNHTLIACAAIAVLAGSASAATVHARYLGLGQTSGTYNINYKNGLFTSTAGAGSLRHQFQNLPGNLFAGQTLRTFCLDIAQLVDTSGNFLKYNITSVANAPDQDLPAGHVIGSARASLLESLYANARQAGLIDHRGSGIGFVDGQHAAAFQLVIWELAFEKEGDHGNIGDGEFKVTNAINAGVSQHFDTFFGWANAGDSLSGLRAMTFAGAQDQIIIIPLPTGGALALAGLTAIAIRRRR